MNVNKKYSKVTKTTIIKILLKKKKNLVKFHKNIKNDKRL